MRFLADESCDFAAVRALRASGHDVAAVAEIAGGAEDLVVIELARSQQRICLRKTRISVSSYLLPRTEQLG
jgi:hypothetical protein